MKHRVLASLHINGAEFMSDERRREIALWLRRQAKFLTDNHKEIATRYRARYSLPEEVTVEERLPDDLPTIHLGPVARG